MRLFELDQQNALATKIVVAIDQLKKSLEKEEIQPNWSIDDLLSYFEKFGVILDSSDLYKMVQQKPLNDVITNIQGDKVIFKGTESSDMPQDQSQEVVAQMAQAAMGNK